MEWRVPVCREQNLVMPDNLKQNKIKMKKKVKPIVFSKETLFPNSDFRVVEEKDQPVVAFHKHNFGEIVFIISGSGVHITEEDEYPLKPGDVFVID